MSIRILATKSDVVSVKHDLREAERRLEAKLEATGSEIIKWVIGSIGLQAVIIVGAIVTLSRLTH